MKKQCGWGKGVNVFWVGLLAATLVFFGVSPGLAAHAPEQRDTPLSPAQAGVQTATLLILFKDECPNRVCRPWDPQAKAAVEYAANIWASLLVSPQPIVIEAYWESFDDPDVLGLTGAKWLFKNFDGAPLTDTWYPVALANKLAGEDLRPDDVDIRLRLNGDRTDWYFGTDGLPPPDRYDLVTVTLHELMHGLGVSGSMRVSADGAGRWGSLFFALGPAPDIYDYFLVNGSNRQLIDTTTFENPSPELGEALTGGDIFFGGPTATLANGGLPPKLHAPGEWEQASSVYELDEAAYPPGSPNALLTPKLAKGEVIRQPGPIVLGILDDLGWGEHPHSLRPAERYRVYVPLLLRRNQ
jgi:hypothetical protein